VTEKLSSTEEAGSTPTPTGEGKPPEAKEPARGFLQLRRRALSEDELSTPAARRFLIFEIERLDQQCQEIQEFVQKYHDQRVIIASLEVSVKASRWNEILSSTCLAVGSAGLGAAPSYVALPTMAFFGWIIFGLSAVLVAGGVASRIWK
jgi:hypothetical protein